MITENLYRYFKSLFIFSSLTGRTDAELAREMGVNPYFLKDYRQAASPLPIEENQLLYGNYQTS